MAGRYPAPAESTADKVVNFPGTDQTKAMSDEEALKIANNALPRGLSDAEREIWQTDVPAYVKVNRFKDHFIRFYREYCIVIARMEENKAYMDDPLNGWTYMTKGRNGIQVKSRPEVAQYNDDWRKLNSLINQIGGSPATDQRFNNLQPSLFDDIY